MIPYTRLHATDRQNLVDVLPLKKPFTVLIEPSSLCNFRCVHCFQSLPEENYFSRQRSHMSMAMYVKIMDQLKAWPGPKFKVLKLSLYGEPLLSPDFAEMLRLAREADIAERIETTTNASLLTEKVAVEMVEHRLDYVRVSIYSPFQAKHEQVTGSMIDIHRIHDNLKMLQDVKERMGRKRPFVALKMLDTYGSENDAFSKMYGDVADEIYLDKPHNWIRTGNGNFMDVLYQDNVGKAQEDIRVAAQSRRACPMGFTTMAIRSNGDIAPCCIDFIGGTNLGHIDKDRLSDLWCSDLWRRFMKMQFEGRQQENASCALCDFYKSSHYTKDDIDGFDVRKLEC